MGSNGKLTRKGTKKGFRQFSIQPEEWPKGIKDLNSWSFLSLIRWAVKGQRKMIIFTISLLLSKAIDYELQWSIVYPIGPSWITGRSKRNIPLPIFQKEPMGKINEFTYTLQ